MLHLYTDGLTETFNPQEEEYGARPLFGLYQNPSLRGPGGPFMPASFQELHAFGAGVSKRDDITL